MPYWTGTSKPILWGRVLIQSSQTMSRRLIFLILALLLLAPLAIPAKKKKKNTGVTTEEEGYVLPPIVDESAKKKKKKPEDETQVLPLPKELPGIITGEVQRLSFTVSPLSGRGLLSAQVREALRATLAQNRGGTVLKIRAFVAGSGDLRRVGTLVSEIFTEKKLPLPVLTTVQVGALPLENAQVVLESISSDKRVLNENGLAFVSGQPTTTADPVTPLKKALDRAGVTPNDVLRVTCFLNTYDKLGEVRHQITSAFPQAAPDFIQLQRGTIVDFVECEAVASLKATPAKPLVMVDAQAGSYSQAALVAPGKIAISGEQLGFHQQDEDVKLAFERLGKTLESAGANYRNTAFLHIYGLTRKAAEQIRTLRFGYVDKANPPASTLLLFEGLPSLDASFGLDVITVIP